MHRIRTLWNNIARVYAWLPVIWRDREWDQCYLYHIMAFKIGRMADTFERNAMHNGYEKNVRDMRMVKDLLMREVNDDHKIGTRHPECSCPEDMMTQDDFVPSQVNGVRTRQWRPRYCSYCKKYLKSWVQYVYSKEKSDTDYMWEVLKKQSGKWWD